MKINDVALVFYYQTILATPYIIYRKRHLTCDHLTASLF
jgi:hypothetical protein